MFEKKDAFEKIKEKLGENTPLSVRSIEEVLETLMPLSKDVELDVFVDTYLPMFKTMEGNVRNDVSEGVKKGLKNHPKPKTKDTDPESTDPEPADDDKADLQKQIEELKNIVLGANAKQEAERIKSSAIAAAKKLYNSGVVETAADGFDFSQEGSEKAFEEKVARIASHLGVVPMGKEDVNTEKIEGLDDFVTELKNRYNEQ